MRSALARLIAPKGRVFRTVVVLVQHPVIGFNNYRAVNTGAGA